MRRTRAERENCAEFADSAGGDGTDVRYNLLKVLPYEIEGRHKGAINREQPEIMARAVWPHRIRCLRTFDY
jgi:hypothetical protein